MAVDNVIIARRFIEEIWSKGNFESIDDIVLRDAHVRDPFMPEGKGPNDVRTLVRTMREAFPDLIIKIGDVISDGNLVSARWTLEGTQKGEWNGIPATNRKLIASGLTFMTIKDAKIQETWNSLDVMATTK